MFSFLPWHDLFVSLKKCDIFFYCQRIKDPMILERVLQEAKETSMREMMQRAQAMGANAIVGIDIDYETVGANGSMLMVATSGTAVII